MALVAFLALGSTGCEVTDLQPQDAISETLAFNTPDRIALAVTGVYNAAQSGYYDALNGTALGTRGYPFGSAATALGDVRGEDVVDMAGFFGIVGLNNITPSSPNVVNMWNNLYSTINQANVVIEGVRKAATAGTITAANAAIYEGEMRFLRALSYHELLLNFARPYNDNNGSNPGVPYRDFPVNTIESLEKARALDRSSVSVVYDKMLEDLDYAETNLPGTRGGSLKVTRATKGAAIALKQRLRIHQSKWAEAKAEGDKLVTGTTTFTAPAANGGYSLQGSPDAAAPGRTTVTSENIFSIENSADDNATTNGSLASVFGSAAATPVGVGGRGLEAISPNLFNASFIPCNDRRRTTLMQQNAGAYYSFKYKDAATYSDFAPLIRYAEVILNQAEAEANIGGANSVRALALLNAVRGRAVDAADLYVGLTGDALIQAILNERRIELIAEGFRWDDIHRLSVGPSVRFSPRPGGGIPRKLDSSQAIAANYNCTTRPAINGSVADIPYTDYRFLWPIPASEIANNPGLKGKNNPGY
ncbi:RagB/SusD family nutrient uptake outer membrane protein [Hymenobacter busanensis]|uniref:RagB/SusD family nutrient uptake outer membrane protein n=2 Tax=Hymenobacter busanensis TaxID=2607656 RepID=A0A7L5A3G1_9BACT|nr:RagB/SusD family nutrient uptake outer membrane protein [Hymenobacter busanensis]QHJ09766.1 RagB/SusD family nutrient uptake outer membrane protein [Hymenobacter busanensis]